MSILRDKRDRERARRDANLWIGGAGGRSGLARPLLGGRRSTQWRHPVIVTPGALPGEEDEFPTPWAWFRGEGLAPQTEDAAVTGWTDEIGNTDPMDQGGSTGARYRAAGINGQAAVYSSTEAFLSASGFTFPDTGQATTFMVCEGVVDHGNIFISELGAPGSSGPSFTIEPSGTDIFVFTGASGFSSLSYSVPPPASVLAVMLVVSDTAASLYVNNVLQDTTTGAATWSTPLAQVGVYIQGDDAGGNLAEKIVWDSALTEVERDQVWAYAQTRYGLS